MTAIPLAPIQTPKSLSGMLAPQMLVTAVAKVHKTGFTTGATAAPWTSEWVSMWSMQSAKALFSPGLGAANVGVWVIAKLVLDANGAPDFVASTKVKLSSVSVSNTDGGYYDLVNVPYPYVNFVAASAFEVTVWGSK